MPFKTPAYPAILTNADWQKKKGVVAKMTTETGVGDLMTKSQAAYKGVNWALFDLSTAAKGMGGKRTNQDVEDAYEAAVKEMNSKGKVLDTASRALEDAAKKLAGEWKKSKTIPSSSTKHAEAVAAAAKAFNYAITSGTLIDALGKEKKGCLDSIATIKAEMGKLNDKLRKYVDGFEKAAKGTKLADYGSLWKENIRGVGTVLPLIAKDHSEVGGEWNVWKQYSNKQVTPKDEKEFKTQIDLLIKTAKALGPKLDKIFA